MKKLIFTTLLLTIFAACKNGNNDNLPMEESFPDGAKYLKNIETSKNRIGEIANMILENPENEEDFRRNDSLMYLWGIENEFILESFGNAYGNVHTDSLLIMFEGYIPETLVQKIQKADWETPIGKSAKEQYDAFLEYKNQFNSLVGKSLCEPKTKVKSAQGIEVDFCELIAEGTYLVDLWASWCAPCRTFNRNFKKQYHSFKNKGIKTIGISIDDNYEAYKQAASRDDLPWNDFIDYTEGVKNMLEIEGVPFQFLVKDGIIIKIIDVERTESELLKFLSDSAESKQ